MKRFPWETAMGFGLGVLKLSPREFWGMTPRELALAYEALSGRRPVSPGRDALEELMRRFPDG